MDFSEILQYAKGHRLTSVCVEAAHIYMDEVPGDEHDFSASLGAQLAKELELADCLVTKMLFVDNINPNPLEFTLDVNRYRDRLQQKGFAPDIVALEAALELSARNLLESLESSDIHRKDDQVFLNHRNILLMDHNRPSCCLLDAAMYVAKLSIFELVITVLQGKYRSQQKKVRKILRALGYTHLPVINVYFDFEMDKRVTIGGVRL